MDEKEVFTDLAAKVVSDQIEHLLSSAEGIAQNVREKLRIATGAAFKKYYETAISKYIVTKTILNTQEPVPLYSIYVGVDLLKGKNTIVDTTEAAGVVTYGKHLIITALAGSGKSTLMKHLFLDSFRGTKQIPVFVELRYLKPASSEEGSFPEIVLEALKGLNLSVGMEAFETLLHSGRLILFLDGFDELPPEVQDRMELEITKFRDKYNNNVIIVSSRPSERFASWTNFLELRIVPLSKQKALDLINKINYDEEMKAEFYKKVDKNLYEKHTSFLSNPLLLIIMLMTYGQWAEIPDKLHLFYQQAFETLFSRHDATKVGYRRVRFCTLPIDDFQRVLTSFCFQSYVNHETSLSEQQIDTYLGNAKVIYPNLLFDERRFLKDLLQSVCILTKDGLLYSFTHRSFQEYFTALFILNADQDVRRKILKNLDDRLIADTCFRMMFDIDRKKIEGDYLVGMIRKLRKPYFDKPNGVEDLFKEMYANIEIRDKQRDYVYIVGNAKLFNLFYFCSSNYMHVFRTEFSLRPPEVGGATLLEAIVEHHKRSPRAGLISMSRLLADPQAREIVLKAHAGTLKQIDAFLKLPEIVGQENSKSKNALELILSKKK